MTTNAEKIVPRAFVWRRVHSLMGLWLSVYLIEHLVTNSQAALWLGLDGIGFVRMVNFFHELPYLQVIEIVLLAIPILLHGVLGIYYAWSARSNAKKTDGTKPEMRYGRSRAYTWQRYTSWVLMFGIALHVVQMRFLEKPQKVMLNQQEVYLTPLSLDEGLYSLAARLKVELMGPREVQNIRASLKGGDVGAVSTDSKPIAFNDRVFDKLAKQEASVEEMHWREVVSSYSLGRTEVLAQAKDPGTAILLAVRNTFKSPFMCALYTIFVLAACYHAFNGFWSFLISWGAILSFRSQKKMVNVSLFVMLVIGFLGLAAIWGSYWVNLRT